MTVEEGRTQALQVSAGMLRVAASLLRDEPDGRQVRELSRSGLFDEVPEGFEDEALSRGFSLLREGLARAEADGSGEGVASLRREWLRLFAGVGEPEVPSWANYYLDPESRLLGRETLFLRGLYAKYGLELERKGAEPDDDLGLMLRFLAYLSELEATGADTAGTRSQLLREHVLPWICTWRHTGLKRAGSPYYRGAIEFTFGLVRVYAASLGFAYRDDARSFVREAQALRQKG